MKEVRSLARRAATVFAHATAMAIAAVSPAFAATPAFALGMYRQHAKSQPAGVCLTTGAQHESRSHRLRELGKHLRIQGSAPCSIPRRRLPLEFDSPRMFDRF